MPPSPVPLGRLRRVAQWLSWSTFCCKKGLQTDKHSRRKAGVLVLGDITQSCPAPQLGMLRGEAGALSRRLSPPGLVRATDPGLSKEKMKHP